jgi:hypothetical protein
MSVNDPTDLPPDDNNACTDQTCTAGMPTFPPVAPGTACAKGVCDDKGNCVNCTKDMDCKMGLKPTCDLTVHTCISCSDGLMNGTETTPDCGGICKTCLGKPCGDKSECGSGQCADGVCCDSDCKGNCLSCNLKSAPGTCTSVPAGTLEPACPGMMPVCNAGGMCKKAPGATCMNDGDCGSGACLAGVCQIETGGNCGSNLTCVTGLCMGGVCAKCAANTDCMTMMCNTVTGVCKAPGGSACEADTDCADGKCQFGLCLVDNGVACGVNADCRSGVCAMGLCSTCSAVMPGIMCSPGASCGSTAFGVMGLICNRPKGAYCSSNLQCEGLKPCVGFPPVCQ